METWYLITTLKKKILFCHFEQANVSAGEIKSAKHWLKKAYKILPAAGDTAKIIKLFKAGR